MSILPESLQRCEDRSLEIKWNDGVCQKIPYRVLRDRCPCAACRTPDEPAESDSGLRILSPAETLPLEILAMSPVGNYAYNIQFSDGHNTGIFTFDLLRRLTDDDQ